MSRLLSFLYLACILVANVLAQDALLPRATTVSCSTTKTITDFTTSTPTYTSVIFKTKTAKLGTYTETYFTTVATAPTTLTVALETTTTCTPTDCSCQGGCYPGCSNNAKRALSTTSQNAAKPCTITSTETLFAPSKTVNSTFYYTYTPETAVSILSPITATVSETVSITSTALYGGPTADYIAFNGQVFHQYSGVAYFGNTLYEGSLLTCGCSEYSDGLPGPSCTYENVTYNCFDPYECQGICASINEVSGKGTCKGALYGGYEYFTCYLNSHYPRNFNGHCALAGLDPDTYILGLLDGWETK